MKQLKYIGRMICSLFFLVSCDKETEGMSKVLHFSLEGDETMLVTVGTSYNEPGYAITLDGVDVSGNVEIRGEVDARNVGLYYVAYIYTNDDGVQTRLNRTVIVCDPTVETDIAGRYATVEGTYRLAGGNEVPFPGFGVNIYKIGPGFFEVSDFLGGYYHQRAGYGAAYAAKGYVQLMKDNTLKLINSSVAGWGDSLTGLQDGVYDPVTGSLSWCADYAGMLFYVVLN